MSLEVEERGTDQLLRFLEGAPANIDKATEEGLDLLGEMAEQKAKEYAPVRTGALRESIHFIRRGFEILLSSRVFYAVFQEFGTRPHLIRPVRARALRWFAETGEPIFAMSVRHPGTQPRLFITRALEEIRPLVLQVLRGKIEEWLRRRGE